MQWFNNLRLSAKLLVSFTVVLLITCALGVLSIERLGDVAQDSSEISGNYLPSLDTLGAINTMSSNIRMAQIRQILASTPQEKAAVATLLQERTALREGYLKKY